MPRRRPAVAAALALIGVGLGAAAVRASDDAGEPHPTGDPALIATGRALFDGLPNVADSRRDAYATACGMPNVDYCVSSPTVRSADLLAHVGDALTAAGARRIRRDCVDALGFGCFAFYAYRGVELMVLGSDTVGPEEIPTPAYVWGKVSTLGEATPVAVPLGEWASLHAVPASWQTPSCSKPAPAGCLQYSGTPAGAASLDEAVADLRATWRAHGYRIDIDACLPGVAKCNLVATRFRQTGGKAGFSVLVAMRSAGPSGFTASLRSWADNF